MDQPPGLSGVRLVARVLFWLGWLAVIAGVLVSLATLGTLASLLGPRGNASSIVAAAMPLLAALMASIGPFFLWALLTVLLETHDRIAAQRPPLIGGAREGFAAVPALTRSEQQRPAEPERSVSEAVDRPTPSQPMEARSAVRHSAPNLCPECEHANPPAWHRCQKCRAFLRRS